MSSDNNDPARKVSAHVARKLAAILNADVKGFSRLMDEDEEATLHVLTAYREIIDTLIHQHHGRIVGTAGDSVLAEFASVIDAVRCAVEIQQQLKARNADLPVHRRMEFRIGINLGDVMVEGEQIYGDGVNVAARLQSLADAGSIFIAGTVYDQVENKLALTYEYLGEQQVKNIARPVRTYRVMLEVPSPLVGEGQGEGATGRASIVTTPHPNLPPQGGKESRDKRRAGIAHLRWIVAGLMLIVASVVALRYLSRLPLSTQDSALRTAAAPAALPLPDKPSIIVLPFVNLSGDPEQEYFSDGITEDLTSALSRLSGLFVISRNTAFFYKGKAVKIPDLSKELGVQYVLEGSVRKADGQVRITAQLIDATQDRHLWSERYERPLKEIFALQDGIVQRMVTTLKLQLTLWEQGFLVRKSTDNLEAYDTFLRGVEYVYRTTQEANAQARQMYEKALELDPQYAAAYAALGWTYFLDWFMQWSPDPQNLEQALTLGQKAIALDDSLSLAHRLIGEVYLRKKQHDQARAEVERALALDPNDADGYRDLGLILFYTGPVQEGLRMVEQAMRLNPHSRVYLVTLGWGYYWTGRYEEAIATFKRVVTHYPNLLIAHTGLATTYGALGQEEGARTEAAEILRLSPNFSLEVVGQRALYKDPAVAERLLNDLRKAGLK
ncbi:MAG TPA: adenylate/guanylate cyclase domain-containing protein [Candidatus Binatia bacterium]|jgi:adenylate cyclase|nr:adenylate/guanylate cyclase domain-containing protein [Candidatus Binatia bacterium]